MKLSLRLCIVLFAFLAFANVDLLAYKTGITGRATVGCSGSGCHNQSSNTTFQLKNLPSSVNAGDKIDLILEVITASSKSNAGLNLIVVDGSNNNVGTITASSGTTVSGGELMHTSPKTISGDRASFSFSWTAPSTAGTYYVKAAGNAVNGDNTPSNDEYAVMSAVSFSVVVPNGKITGTILQDGAGVAGVSVSAGSKSATTDANGVYTISSLTNGAYTVTPTKGGLAFTPPSTNVNISNNTVTANFTAEKNAFNVSGKVTLNGAGLAAVTVKYGTSQSVQTDANGNYTIANVTKGTALTITPSKTGFEFDPANKQVTVNGDMTGQDFTASLQAYKIRGKVSINGTGLPGVTISWGQGKDPVMTSADGNYEISGVTAGTYTLVPALDGYSFTPPSMEVQIVQSTVSQKDFAATQEKGSISGMVSKNSQPLANIAIMYKSATSEIKSVMTGSDGKYLISGLDADTYMIAAIAAGMTFTPESLSVVVAKGASVTGKDFMAADVKYSISGKVMYQNMPLAGVELTYGSATKPKTDANGEFNIEGLSKGKITIVPYLMNYIFIPDTLEMDIEEDMMDVVFNAYLAKLDKVSNLFPENNAMDVNPNSELTWNMVENATNYEIMIKALDDSFNGQEILDNAIYTLSNLDKGKSYSWKVRAINMMSNVMGEWSDELMFTTSQDAPDPILTLEPIDEAIDINPKAAMLKWEAMGDIDSYEVQYTTELGFNSNVQTLNGLQNNEVVLPELEGLTMYYWRVRAIKGISTGAWSSVKSFTTAIKVSVENPDDLVNLFNFNVSPNPISKDAKISINLPKSEFVNISLIDITGNTIMNIYSKQMETGLNNINASFQNISEGAYIALVKIGSNNYSYQIRIVK